MAERDLTEPRSTDRREFLHRCAICAGVAVLPPAWARLLRGAEQHRRHTAPTAGAQEPLGFKYFSPAQAAIVEAVSEQIIPADEDPGAKWAGVVHYIDLGLAGDLKEFRSAYAAGLRRLAALTQEMSPKPFDQLDFATQTQVLEKLERDDTREDNAPSGHDFFRVIRQHTLQGFFGDPQYGGNRDFVGWKILKFEG